MRRVPEEEQEKLQIAQIWQIEKSSLRRLSLCPESDQKVGELVADWQSRVGTFCEICVICGSRRLSLYPESDQKAGEPVADWQSRVDTFCEICVICGSLFSLCSKSEQKQEHPQIAQTP